MATGAAPEVTPAFGTVFGAIKANADFSRSPPQPDLFVFAKPDGAKAMMNQAGLQVVSHETVPAFWELSHPEELFATFRTAMVAAARLITGQKPEVVEAIREQITHDVREKYRDGAGYRVPVPVAVV